LQTETNGNKMTAIDLRANTTQILDQFDKADASLWQRVLDAVVSIYRSEEEMLLEKGQIKKPRFVRWLVYSMKKNLLTGNVKAKADCLITLNIKDFGFAKMEFMDSQSFLTRYK